MGCGSGLWFPGAYNSKELFTTMIVPEFKLRQDERFVSIFIRVPYIKVSACEFYVQASAFKFFLKPYLLSLSFEQRLREVEEPAKAVYYHEKYILEVHLEKENPGEQFSNLDLIANVVNRKKEKKSNKVSIEVVGGDASPQLSEESKLPLSEYNYGFCQQYSNVFDNLEEEVAELFAFNPRDTPLPQRFPLSRDIIANEFDHECYLFDKYENEEIDSVIKDKTTLEYLDGLSEKDKGPEIGSEEFRIKMKITKKELLLSPQTIPAIKKEILSILFSYLHELVCMGGELGPESARTINETSLVLSCNASYGDMPVHGILVDCFRRCMAYSLYRSLKVCRHVQRTLTKFLSKSYVRIILEDLRGLFERNEPRYLLNRIYIDDYLLYVYGLKQEEEFWEFVSELEGSVIEEGELGLGIEEYEQGEQSVEEQKKEQKKEAASVSENAEESVGERKLVEEIERLNTLD